jgi:SAM-dependent methyltransferase
MAEPRSLDWLGQEASPELAARLAELYDLGGDGGSGDVDFYRALARRAAGRILELGCGTGRIAIPLARDGYRVTGIDVSSAQLDLARRKAADAGVELEFVLADMRDFALPEPFELIIVPSSSFLILPPPERPAALARAREHLTPDGTFVLDVFQPDPGVIAASQGALVHEWTRVDPSTGNTVVRSSSSTADVDGVTFSYIYDDIDPHGAVRRYIRTARLHFLYRRELELLLASCGFGIEALYGSFDLEPLTPSSPRLIALAKRRERGAGPNERRRSR